MNRLTRTDSSSAASANHDCRFRLLLPGGDAWDGGLDSGGDDSGGDPDPDPDSVPVPDPDPDPDSVPVPDPDPDPDSVPVPISDPDPDPDPDPGPEPDVFGSAGEPVWLARVVVLSPGVVVVVVVAPGPAADTEDSV